MKYERVSTFYCSSTIYHWTNSLEECYLRGCRCEGCYYDNFFKNTGQKCQCKYAVWAYIRKKGLPEDLKKREKRDILDK